MKRCRRNLGTLVGAMAISGSIALIVGASASAQVENIDDKWEASYVLDI